jgi:hypothetical protein
MPAEQDLLGQDREQEIGLTSPDSDKVTWAKLNHGASNEPPFSGERPSKARERVRCNGMLGGRMLISSSA